MKQSRVQHDGTAPHYAVIVGEWHFLIVGLIDVGVTVFNGASLLIYHPLY